MILCVSHFIFGLLRRLQIYIFSGLLNSFLGIPQNFPGLFPRRGHGVITTLTRGDLRNVFNF